MKTDEYLKLLIFFEKHYSGGNLETRIMQKMVRVGECWAIKLGDGRYRTFWTKTKDEVLSSGRETS